MTRFRGSLAVLSLVLAQLVVAPALGHDASPRATVSQRIGMATVTLDYGRPGVKGRVIWGELVPRDQVWRTGADKATTISLSAALKINGTELPAGTYALLTIPGQNEWTIIFHKNTELMGTRNYDEANDALRVKVEPQSAAHRERMIFTFDNLAMTSADVVLHWEKVKVSFSLEEVGGETPGR